ncbi:MAG: 16S rRNA (adenine(1518)-N(6)/adenine(1519)-N(6))-dimethyltransferase RsmA [Bacilli bacterium]|nr:16S rRNA (adenine(1518)-N(6)/adenine(1519)-N(6))-dimethyltransferase RsmA [Bacilli bacterium]
MNQEQFYNEVKSYKLIANKSLGQNFLINPDVCQKIVGALELKENDNCLEIGAGLGSLSYQLANQPAKSTLIDIDERMLSFLNDHFGKCENIEVKRMNALKEDLSSYNKIVGNLPYYITSGIIECILLKAVNIECAVLMVQKEVLVKLNSNEVSPLSMFLKYVGKIETVANVSKVHFAPVPHVDSAVFKFTANENIKNTNNPILYKLISHLFLLRRKTILNNLTSVLGNKDASNSILEEMNINPLLRPEQLDINFYINLLNVLKLKGFINKI